MNPNYEVISDFLDGEAFEPQALGEALADPAGRDLLIDFVIVRYAAQADEAAPVATRSTHQSSKRFLVAAAAVLAALATGYQLGYRRVEPDSTRPPTATRVIRVDWQSVSQESVR
jgi:hypothetical protein